MYTCIHKHTHTYKGDFAILLKTGMRWYTALFFNVLSQITGIAGFFVGAAISSISEDANGWILAIAAGVFLYIALVDLVSALFGNNCLVVYIYMMYSSKAYTYINYI